MSKSKRVLLYDEEAEALGLSLNKKLKGTKKARYLLNIDKLERLSVIKSGIDNDTSTSTPGYNEAPLKVLQAWNYDLGRMMDIDEYCEFYGLPRADITSYKLVSHTGTPYYNTVYKERLLEAEAVKEIDFEAIVSKFIVPLKFDYVRKFGVSSDFDRLVYTDVHIGMDTNSNGFSLYGGKWDMVEVADRLDKIVNHVLANQDSNVLVVDELGDFMDGWDGQTTRKGHELPQNMDNETAFDVGLTFKVSLMDALAPHYDSIIFHNICNDNHAGSFGYVVNKAFMEIAKARYGDTIKVVNIRKFMHHYFIAGRCFILTHGKDGKHLKFGFKPILDSKQIEKIKDYIDENKILFQSEEIEFSKGDSHQYIFDDSTSDSFNYYNYPATSPSSEWVQTNFKKGKSGIVFFNFKTNGTKSIHPLMFKWDTSNKTKAVDYGKKD